MVNITYRHYQHGDEYQLAELFNKAFQAGGFGFVRTTKSWNWRYVQSPGFDPEMIQIAEDIDHHKIVGMICVNPIERIHYNDSIYLNGNLNDVVVHPDYIKRGIATKLMEKSIKYMKKKQCDISLLFTRLHGFPRKKIYSKFKYKDLIQAIGYINFPNFYRLIRELPIIIVLVPALILFSYIPRLVNKIRIRVNSFFKNFNYEIIQNNQHFKFRNTFLQSFEDYYTGYPSFRNEHIIWTRIKVSSKNFEPTYIIIKKNKRVIGGVVLTHANIYSFKYGLKLKLGITHELFLDKNQCKNEKEMHFTYLYLIDKLLKAATKRFIGVLLIIVNNNNYTFKRALKTFNFFRFQESSIMMLKLNKESKISKPSKFLFIPTYLSLGFP